MTHIRDRAAPVPRTPTNPGQAPAQAAKRPLSPANSDDNTPLRALRSKRSAPQTADHRPRLALPVAKRAKTETKPSPAGADGSSRLASASIFAKPMAPSGACEVTQADRNREDKRLFCTWKQMANDWGWLLTAYQKYNGKASGQAMLRALRDATLSSQPDDIKTGVPNVQSFLVQLHEALPPVRALTMGDGIHRKVRLAQSDSPDVLEKTAKQLAAQAKRQAGVKSGAQGIKRDTKQYELWRSRRQDPALQSILAAWRAGVGAHQGGDYIVLSYLKGLMDAAQGDIPDERYPQISRFKLSIPGIEGKVDLLCRLGEDGKIDDLRSVPEETRDVGHVLNELKVTQERRKTTQHLSLRQDERCHKHMAKTLVEALPEEFKAFCKTEGLGTARNRTVFLRHVNELCENAAQNVVVDPDNDVRRYVVLPKGSRNTVTLLRRVDERGLQALRLVRKPSDEADVIKKLRTGLKKYSTLVQTSSRPAPTKVAAPATEPGPSAVAPTAAVAASEAGKERRLADAEQLLNLLKMVVENKRQKLPLMHNVEKTTGISEMNAWQWLRPDGTLKREPRAVWRLRGYRECRVALRGQLAKLGDPTELPDPLNAAQLVELVLALNKQPGSKIVKLSSVTGLSVYGISQIFNGQYFAFAPSTLRSMPDYSQHWRALKKVLDDGGFVAQAKNLPEPERLPETFLRLLDEHHYLIRLIMGELQADANLPVDEAVQRVTASSEVKDVAEKLLVSGGALRTPAQISADVPGLDSTQVEALEELVSRFKTKPATPGMTTRMLRAQKPWPAKVFILKQTGKPRPFHSDNRILEAMYKDSEQLIAKPRSYRGEPEKQVLRWLSTVVKVLFPKAREVQTYWDADESTIWLSSNKREVNAALAKQFQAMSVMEALNTDAAAGTKPRLMRHLSKLKRALDQPESDGDGKPDGGPDAAPRESGRDPVLKAIRAGTIRIPTEVVVSEKTGMPAQLHAERRIKRAFEKAHKEAGRTVDWRLMSGVMRPCGTCAKDLGLPPEAHRGPFWISQAAGEGHDIEQVIQENLKAGIGTTVSELQDGGLNFYANTDSDSEAEGAVGVQRAAKRKGPDLDARAAKKPAHVARAALPLTTVAPSARPAMAPPPAAIAAWPIAQQERDFIRAFVGHEVPTPQRAREALREAVVAQVQRFNSESWHRDDVFSTLDTMLDALPRDVGVDVARAMRLAATLGEPLGETLFNITVRQRQTDLQQLQEQAEQATIFLRGLPGVSLPFEVPMNRQQIQQVLQTLLDQGATRFKSCMRRMSKNPQARPADDLAQVLPIARHYGELRRSSALLGRLPAESSPTDALRGEQLPKGNVWRRDDVERLFAQGQAIAALTASESPALGHELGDEGMSNICWFDAIAQLKLGKRRGKCTAEEVEMVEFLALRLRQSSDALGMSRKNEMFEADNGAMHVIAHALQLQIHTFQQEPDGQLGLTPLQSVGSPSDQPVYLHCNDTHYEPMWRR